MLLGCFSILPATDLVPGDIVEVCGKLTVQILTSQRWRFSVQNVFCEVNLLFFVWNEQLDAKFQQI